MSVDVELYFDPICPFCWQTSKWLRQVQRLNGMRIGYRFISLRFLNEPLGYEDRPAHYPAVHREGTRLLRVAAATRAVAGDEAVGVLYERMGEALWEVDPPPGDGFDAILAHQAQGADIPAIVRAAGLPADLALAADDADHDELIREETEEALRRAGDDVGTPILSFSPPAGPAFFGPVISDLPSDDEAVELYEAIRRTATWPGFSELKRSLRTLPDTRIMSAMNERETRAS